MDYIKQCFLFGGMGECLPNSESEHQLWWKESLSETKAGSRVAVPEEVIIQGKLGKYRWDFI